jgi:hypothetical protein
MLYIYILYRAQFASLTTESVSCHQVMVYILYKLLKIIQPACHGGAVQPLVPYRV